MATQPINIYLGENAQDDATIIASIAALTMAVVNMQTTITKIAKDIETIMALTDSEEQELTVLAGDVTAFSTELQAAQDAVTAANAANATAVAALQAQLTQAGVDTATAQAATAALQAQLDANTAELDTKLGSLVSSFNAILPAPVVAPVGNTVPPTTGP